MEYYYGDYPKLSTSYYASTPVGLQASAVFHVPLCCDSCVQKIRKSLAKEGVDSINVDMEKSKLIVTGFTTPERMLRRIRKVKKSAAFWDSSHDYEYKTPYSHTADYDYTDPHAFDTRRRYYSTVYDHGYGSRRYPSYYDNDYYSSMDSYHGSGHGRGYRSSLHNYY